MINTLYLPELREMLAENNGDELHEFCTALHAARTAEFMEGLTPDEAWQVLTHADAPLRTDIFNYFEHDKQVQIIESQDRQQIAELVAQLPPDDRVDMLEGVNDAVVEELLPLLPTDERRDYLRLKAYPESTAGAIMTTEVAKLAESLTAEQALRELGRQAHELETIYYLYVVDDTDHLRGIVSARQLVSAIGKPQKLLSEMMETDIVYANVFDDQEDVAQKVARYNLLAIPIVDNDLRMVGIVTHDDVIDVVMEEAAEDAHRIAGVEPLDKTYAKTSVLELSFKRGIWLTVLFIGALLTAFALQKYEHHLDTWTWLVLFLPLVISAGGNSGSQSATLIITALATGDVFPKDWLRIVSRELLMGLLLGGFLALIGFCAALFLVPAPGDAFVVPLTLILVVVSGTVCGSILPLVFQRLGLDPAMMSNPFVAGIIDILGIVIYMNVAFVLLG